MIMLLELFAHKGIPTLVKILMNMPITWNPFLAVKQIKLLQWPSKKKKQKLILKI